MQRLDAAGSGQSSGKAHAAVGKARLELVFPDAAGALGKRHALGHGKALQCGQHGHPRPAAVCFWLKRHRNRFEIDEHRVGVDVVGAVGRPVKGARTRRGHVKGRAVDGDVALNPAHAGLAQSFDDKPDLLDHQMRVARADERNAAHEALFVGGRIGQHQRLPRVVGAQQIQSRQGRCNFDRTRGLHERAGAVLEHGPVLASGRNPDRHRGRRNRRARKRVGKRGRQFGRSKGGQAQQGCRGISESRKHHFLFSFLIGAAAAGAPAQSPALYRPPPSERTAGSGGRTENLFSEQAVAKSLRAGQSA